MDSPRSAPVRPLATSELLGGRYRLGALLGRGGMAQVFAAVDVVLHRQVAVKVFTSAAETDLRTSEREVQVLGALSHPGLVMIYDAGNLGGPPDLAAVAGDTGPGRSRSEARPYIVMELVDGPSLSTRLRESGPRPRAEVAAIGAQVARALSYVHATGLIHRDVKPGNILLDETREGPVVAKLADFGIARFADSTRHTMTGTTLGTAPYLSPEQVRGEALAPPTDIYALGLVLLEALTGRVEYPGAAVESAVARLHREPQVPADLGRDWVRLLHAMTDHDPVRRPTAERVATTLEDLATGQTSRSDTASLALPGQRMRARAARAARGWPHPVLVGRRQARAVATVGLAIATLTGVVLSAQGTEPPAAPAPSYPSVPGPVGTDLEQLQRQVTP